MASRMESTGASNLIQLGQESNDLLKHHYPQFTTTERGQVEIKVGSFFFSFET
jgi:hypothetical protein